MGLEIVIPDFADKYEQILKCFDQRIKNSNLKKVKRTTEYEWKLGLIRIILLQLRNDIICRLILPSGSIPPTRVEVELRRALADVQTEIFVYELSKPDAAIKESKKKLVDCFNCGMPISRSASFCPHCGSDLKKCIVCNLVIGKGENIAKCPNCGGFAHKTHLLEYIKIKVRCPLCGKVLKKLK